MDKTEEAIRIGKRVEAMMGDDLLLAAFDAVGVDITQAWMATAPTEHDQREMLWLKLKVIDEVRSKLLTAIANGKIASKKLDA